MSAAMRAGVAAEGRDAGQPLAAQQHAQGMLDGCSFVRRVSQATHPDSVRGEARRSRHSGARIQGVILRKSG